ncbi:hypothetical protein KIL84_015409 [Mauremys mutica]|uniref:Uncharacterized protein n=1 Tax=Mauremys mutica TaxID=74926 RepID=A0A9D3WQF3_9SAUR|nr:hypothetical protein KIL84_015409 [Mauremys mutica]
MSLPVAPSTSSAYAQVVAAPPLAATSSFLVTASATISGSRSPFPTLTRKHGIRCLLVPASPHVETYVVGPTAIVVASKMYGKAEGPGSAGVGDEVEEGKDISHPLLEFSPDSAQDLEGLLVTGDIEELLGLPLAV